MHGSTRLAGACAVEWFETGMQVRQDQLIKIRGLRFFDRTCAFWLFRKFAASDVVLFRKTRRLQNVPKGDFVHPCIDMGWRIKM